MGLFGFGKSKDKKENIEVATSDNVEFNLGTAGATCPVCGRSLDDMSVHIADAVICSDCARKERGMYFTDSEEGDELTDVTLDNVKEDMEIAKGHMGKAIQRFPDAAAVAYIDEQIEDGSKTVLSVGSARGTIASGDEVVLVHGDEEINATVVKAIEAVGPSYETVSEDSGFEGSIVEGYSGWLVFEGIEGGYSLDDVVYKR